MIALPLCEQSSITVVPSPPWSDAERQQEGSGKEKMTIMEKDDIPTIYEEQIGGGGDGLEACPFLATSSSGSSSSLLDNTNIIIDPKDKNSMKDSNNSLRMLSETLTYELRAMREETTALRDELRLLG